MSKVLRSLTRDFDHVVARIEEAKDLSTCSFDALMSSLLASNAQINRPSKKVEGKAFQVKGGIFPTRKNQRTQISHAKGRGGHRALG